ncbi:MAG: hypothetical protein U5K54_19400 [Cytophagales bacterium]|nr:hypothetical protein [Cytophagales bacterium]
MKNSFLPSFLGDTALKISIPAPDTAMERVCVAHAPRSSRTLMSTSSFQKKLSHHNRVLIDWSYLMEALAPCVDVEEISCIVERSRLLSGSESSGIKSMVTMPPTFAAVVLATITGG